MGTKQGQPKAGAAAGRVGATCGAGTAVPGLSSRAAKMFWLSEPHKHSSSPCPERGHGEDKAQLGTGDMPAERMPGAGGERAFLVLPGCDPVSSLTLPCPG